MENDQQNSQLTSQVVPKNNNVLWYVILIAVIFVVGGGVFFWKNTEVQEKELKITELSNQVSLLSEELFSVSTELEKLTCKGRWEENVGCVKIPLVVLSPNGGEKFCIGEKNLIKWNAPKNMKAVSVSITTPNGSAHNIGEFKAVTSIEENIGVGSIDWYGQNVVKQNISPGEVYEIVVYGTYIGEQLQDRSDNSFSLQYCN